MRGATYWIWEHCVPHTEIKQRRRHGRWFCKEGSNRNSPCFPESNLRLVKKRGDEQKKRFSFLPWALPSTGRYSVMNTAPLCLRLAQLLLWATHAQLQTHINLYIYAVCGHVSSSSRSANWFYSVLLDTEHVDKFRTLTLISQPCLKSQTWGITVNISQLSRA